MARAVAFLTSPQVRRPSTPVRAHRGPSREPEVGPEGDAAARFRVLDEYRVDREWKRYEGTAQRDLFRELRRRFLERHPGPGPHAIDVGSGPGRFAGWVGPPESTPVLLDLSDQMLRSARARLRTSKSRHGFHFVRGDAGLAPFRPGTFGSVVVMGNALGFAADGADQLFSSVTELVAPGGLLVLETVAGAGERSKYLGRLPPGAVRRLLAAPLHLVRGRIEREGFRPEAGPSRPASGFRRLSAAEVTRRLTTSGFEVEETVAVAPALGADAERVSAVRLDPLGWRRLLELEEHLGRTAPRQAQAAALLVAARRPPARSPGGRAAT